MGDTSPRSNHGCLLFLGRDWLHIADDNSPTGSTTKDKLSMGRVRALTSSIMLNPQLQRNRLPRANNTRPGERSNRPAPCFARLIRQHPPSGEEAHCSRRYLQAHNGKPSRAQGSSKEDPRNHRVCRCGRRRHAEFDEYSAVNMSSGINTAHAARYEWEDEYGNIGLRASLYERVPHGG